MKQTERWMRIALTCVVLGMAAGPAWAHDEGHAPPDQLPPIGPHGGRYAKLQKHFAEIVVQGDQVTLYILEPDVKYVAEDARGVTLAYEIQGGSGRQTVELTREGQGYKGTIQIPVTARRVVFYVSCVLDQIRESGQVSYEPRR